MKKIHYRLIKIFVIIFLSAIIYSCVDMDEFDKIAEVRWDPKYAVPLVNGSLGIEHLLNEEDSSALYEYDDGLYYLVYENELESREISDLVVIPDKSLTRSYQKATEVIIPANDRHLLYEKEEVLELNMSPEEISKIGFKAGILKYYFSTSVDAVMVIKVTLPTLIKQQVPFQFQFTKTGGSYQDHQGMESLIGYIADLSTLSPAYNRIPIKIEVVIESNSQPVTISTADYVNFQFDFLNMDYKYTEGYFGRQEVSIPAKTVKVGPFGKTFDEAELSVRNARIDLIVINEYGIPGQITINNFEARKSGGESIRILTDPASPVIIKSPVNIDEPVKTLIGITNSEDVFNIQPDEFYYNISALINPADLRKTNFMMDTSKLKLNLRTEIPLYGTARNIVLEDTLEFSLADDIEGSEVQEALMKIKIVNEFPLDAMVQVYFTDQNFNVTDSLLLNEQKNIIVASQVDNQGELIPGRAGVYDEIITISNQTFENLLDADNLIIYAELNTARVQDQYPDVKIKSDYQLSIDLGIQTHLNLSLKP